MVVIQMETVSQGGFHLTSCRHVKCGCVQERNFKDTTPLIPKSTPETVGSSYLEKASFSILKMKSVPIKHAHVSCRCLKLLKINIDPI